MLQLSGKGTVPQVFFNEEHVGGADDTLNRLFLWKVEAKEDAPTPLECYQTEIAERHDPEDPRLSPSTEVACAEIGEHAKEPHKEHELFLTNNKRRFVLFPIHDEQVSSVDDQCTV